jgi:hypothetical protein
MQQKGPALVRPLADQDTIKVLADLLELAKRGEIVGLAYVALHKGCGYSSDVVGSVRNSPLLARGLASTLWEQIPVRNSKLK